MHPELTPGRLHRPLGLEERLRLGFAGGEAHAGKERLDREADQADRRDGRDGRVICLAMTVAEVAGDVAGARQPDPRRPLTTH